MKSEKLPLETWRNIITNVSELEENEFGNEVEVVRLDEMKGNKENYCLCHGYDCFEEGFKTEQEAWARYEEILGELRL